MTSTRMHDDEVDLDVPLVRRLLSGQFPHWADLPLRRFPSGGTVNALFRLGPEMVVRLPLVPTPDSEVGMMRRWLPQLAPLLPVAVPELLGVGTPSADYPGEWSVWRWLTGHNPDPDHLDRPDLLAGDLARFVTAYRRIDLPDPPPAYRGGPLSSQDSATRRAIGELHGQVDTAAVTAAWEADLAALDWSERPVWVHADLMPGNLLTTDGRLTAVIDFGTTGAGDPACDLIVAWNLLPADARESFRAGVDVDEATWARGRGRALSMALIQLPYYRHTNLTMATNARHVLREVLADHARTGG